MWTILACELQNKLREIDLEELECEVREKESELETLSDVGLKKLSSKASLERREIMASYNNEKRKEDILVSKTHENKKKI